MDPAAQQLLSDPRVQQMISQEQQNAVLVETVAKITSACWDKCITGTPGSKFSSSEATCLSNCGKRYLDTMALIVKRFQSIQN